MRVLICGGRNFDDRLLFLKAIADFEATHGQITTIIEGGALGADRIAKQYAHEADLKLKTFIADFYVLSHPRARIKIDMFGRKYDAAAGPRRNQRMIDEGRPDHVIAFPGESGTADMVARAKRAGIPVTEVAS